MKTKLGPLGYQQTATTTTSHCDRIGGFVASKYIATRLPLKSFVLQKLSERSLKRSFVPVLTYHTAVCPVASLQCFLFFFPVDSVFFCYFLVVFFSLSTCHFCANETYPCVRGLACLLSVIVWLHVGNHAGRTITVRQSVAPPPPLCLSGGHQDLCHAL